VTAERPSRDTAQAAVRLQQKVEELCAASIRALAGEPDLHFRGRRLQRAGRRLPLFAPHLHPSLEHDDFASFRGAADGLALRLLLSDAALHARLAPADPGERFVFDLLEQYRVEAAVPEALPGARRNLRHRHEAWSLAFHHAGHTDGAVGLLLYTIAQVCRARVTGDPVPEETEDLLEATRAGLAPLIGHALAGLRRDRADQAAYARHALDMARAVGDLLREAGEGTGAREAPRPDDEMRNVFGLLIETETDTSERFATEVGGARVVEDGDDDYRVFTTAYDREEPAAALVRRPVLVELRERLDALVAGHGINHARLVRELRALFDRPRHEGWDGGQEEGLVDGARLARLVSTPADRHLFRSERREPRADCALTFLVDCSGSMKEHAPAVAILVDSFSRALEQAGVSHEILGFSTAAWNGGRARRDWLRAGRPDRPGRLNERSHIVFKSASTPWRRARPEIAALLKADLFREGIDGEAVEWACARLQAREEAQKILLVVSDGSPMDSATQLVNAPQFLDRHLRRVVQRVERRGAVRVFGVGVGLDLSPYYERSHVLDLGGAIGNAMFREIVEMLAGRHRR
jgi:cobaltochelatase CobT